MTDPTNQNNAQNTPDLTFKPVQAQETAPQEKSTQAENIAVMANTETPITPVAPITPPIATVEPTIEQIIPITPPIATQEETPSEPISTKSSSQKILKIAIPSVVAIVLLVGGYLAYSAFTSTDEANENENTQTETESTSIESSIPQETSNLEESLMESIEENAQSVETPADYSETDYSKPQEEQTPQQKVPRI